MEVVPIVEIDGDSLSELRPMLLAAVRMAQYVSIDLELSGLGDKPDISRKDIRSRYDGMRRAAQKYSILSIGIACFNGDSNHASIFQLSCIPSDDLVINLDTAKFLVKHGFDFNKLVQQPVQYKKNGEESELKELMIEILKGGKVIVVHNGLLDLCHLYNTFIAPLPEKFERFTQNWSQILTATNSSLLDSKLVCRSLFKMAHSSLSFIYLMSRVRGVLCLTFPPYAAHPPSNESGAGAHAERVTWVKIDLDSGEERREEKLCANLLRRAFCSNKHCKKSHSIVKLVDYYKEKTEKNRTRRKRRHERKSTADDPAPTRTTFESGSESDSESEMDKSSPIETEKIISISPGQTILTGSAHRAGCDAFMAGYALLAYVAANTLPRVEKPLLTGPLAKLDAFRNRINGPGAQGILFASSQFVTTLSDDPFDAIFSKFES